MSKTDATNGEVTEKKDRAPRTPREPKSIFKAVMELPLGEQVELAKQLKARIAATVGDLKSQAEQAAKIAEGV